MFQDNGLILEILKQNETLKMSLSGQRELVSTLRHYSIFSVDFSEIDKLCREALAILNKADKRGMLDSGSISDFKKIGQLLYDHLFAASVKERLKNSLGVNLILSVDEELIGIPWEILHDGKEFLCLKFSLGRLIRTKEQKNPPQYRNLEGELKMLILANPTDDLKSAYLEGAYIKNQFDRRRRNIGIDFKSTSISTLYVKKNLRDYDIVHFAGHCEYDRHNPKNTGWVLSDGKLSMQDINVMGQTLNLPSLVFSNACYSAKLDRDLAGPDYQEKTYSLASAFLYSGVRHYIGTIRRIEDPASIVFAKEFYTQLITGKTVGECLRLGRLKLIEEYGFDSISWASYLLYGDPNFNFFGIKTRQNILAQKKRISSYRRHIFWFFLAVVTVLLCMRLYIWLPTKNPTAYFLFLKSRSLSQQGRNSDVILAATKAVNKDPLFLQIYPLLADTYQKKGDKANAVKYYFEYLLCSEKKGDKKNLANAYIGLGWTYHLYGEFEKAADFYNKAMNLSIENKDKLNEAKVLRKFAIWHIDNEHNDRALELLMKSSEINRERQYIYEHKYNLACDYFNIGLVFSNKKDYVTARDFYAKSRILFEKLKLKDELSDCYFNLGEICLFEKEYQKARDYYIRGLEIDKKRDNKFKLAADYNMIGELYASMDDLAEAEKFFNLAVSLSKQIGVPAELASACYNLAIIYKHRGQRVAAAEYFRQAQGIYRDIDIKRYRQLEQEFLDLSYSPSQK